MNMNWPSKVTTEVLPGTGCPQFRQWVTSGIAKLDTAGCTWRSLRNRPGGGNSKSGVTKSVDGGVARSWADYLHTGRDRGVTPPRDCPRRWEPFDDHTVVLEHFRLLFSSLRADDRLVVWHSPSRIRSSAKSTRCHWTAMQKLCWTWQTRRGDTAVLFFWMVFGIILWNWWDQVERLKLERSKL